MGIEASKPKPGAKFQVIGAGLPRTGTASLAAALSILFDGPIYHGGTQVCKSGNTFHMRAWTDILSHTPFKTSKDEDYVKIKMKTVLDGDVGCADTPMAQFVPELMELYPGAKVICTVRDADAWAKSMDQTAQASL
ncbi:hypothetical protein CLAFUR0_04217 [Fulvia fulva]|nr:hypothetical protein CLAFUR0_04217 [Fulvia fulva]